MHSVRFFTVENKTNPIGKWLFKVNYKNNGTMS